MQAMLGNTLRKHLGAPKCSSHHKHISSTSLCRLLACNRAAGAGCKSPTLCTLKWRGDSAKDEINYKHETLSY